MWTAERQLGLLRSYRAVSSDTIYDRGLAFGAILQKGFNLAEVSEELQSDRLLVGVAVTQDGLALRYASEELQNDRDVVLAAVTQEGHALHYASEELQNDREVVLAAVTQNGHALHYASEELKNDRDVVLAAVTQHGLALHYASEELQNDRDVVLAAVTQHGLALEYASEELQNDRDVVLAAVTQEGLGLDYASEELQNDREVVLAAVTQYGEALEYASEALRNDRDVVLAAVTAPAENGSAAVYASQQMRDNILVIFAAQVSGFPDLSWLRRLELAAIGEEAIREEASGNEGRGKDNVYPLRAPMHHLLLELTTTDLQNLESVDPGSVKALEKEVEVTVAARHAAEQAEMAAMEALGAAHAALGPRLHDTRPTKAQEALRMAKKKACIAAGRAIVYGEILSTMATTAAMSEQAGRVTADLEQLGLSVNPQTVAVAQAVARAVAQAVAAPVRWAGKVPADLKPVNPQTVAVAHAVAQAVAAQVRSPFWSRARSFLARSMEEAKALAAWVKPNDEMPEAKEMLAWQLRGAEHDAAELRFLIARDVRARAIYAETVATRLAGVQRRAVRSIDKILRAVRDHIRLNVSQRTTNSKTNSQNEVESMVRATQRGCSKYKRTDVFFRFVEDQLIPANLMRREDLAPIFEEIGRVHALCDMTPELPDDLAEDIGFTQNSRAIEDDVELGIRRSAADALDENSRAAEDDEELEAMKRSAADALDALDAPDQREPYNKRSRRP